MNERQKAAYVMSQASVALIIAFGMMSENLQRVNNGQAIAYGEDAFENLTEKFGITRNQVIACFQE